MTTANRRLSLKPIPRTKPKTTQDLVSGLPKFVSHTDVFLKPRPEELSAFTVGTRLESTFLFLSVTSSCPTCRSPAALSSILGERASTSSCWHSQTAACGVLPENPFLSSLGQRSKKRSLVWRAQLKLNPARFLGSNVTGGKNPAIAAWALTGVLVVLENSVLLLKKKESLPARAFTYKQRQGSFMGAGVGGPKYKKYQLWGFLKSWDKWFVPFLAPHCLQHFCFGAWAAGRSLGIGFLATFPTWRSGARWAPVT